MDAPKVRPYDWRMAEPAKPSMGCGYFLTAFLAIVGLAVVWSAQTAYRSGQSTTTVLITAGFGVLTLAAAFAVLRPIRRHVQRKAQLASIRSAHPDEPWRWRLEWSGPAIESRDATGLGMIWFFAIVWNAISFPAAIAVLLQPNVERAAYFVFLFPVIGTGLLYLAVHKTIQVRKFGRVLFVPSTMPGAIGGYLGGVIEVPARVAIERDARLTLRCVRRITTGSGKNRSTRETVQWEREERIPREKWTSGHDRTEIPVLFHIPEGSDASDDSNPNNQLLWLLTAAAEVPGVDFESTFEVPVFFTGETAPPPERNQPALDTYSAAPPDENILKRSGIEHAGGVYRFGSSHMTGSRIFFTITALVLCGVLAAFWNEGVPVMAWVIVGFFAFIFVSSAINLWVGSCEVRIEASDVLVIRRGLFRGKETRLPRADIARVELHRSMTAGSTEYYSLKFIRRDGAMANPSKLAVEFAKHIPGRANSEAIAEMVMGEVGRHSAAAEHRP